MFGRFGLTILASACRRTWDCSTIALSSRSNVWLRRYFVFQIQDFEFVILATVLDVANGRGNNPSIPENRFGQPARFPRLPFVGWVHPMTVCTHFLLSLPRSNDWARFVVDTLCRLIFCKNQLLIQRASRIRLQILLFFALVI